MKNKINIICSILLIVMAVSFYARDIVLAEENYTVRKRELISRIITQYKKAKNDLNSKLEQCSTTIKKCYRIIDAARKSGNKKAEEVAQKALNLSLETNVKYKKKMIMIDEAIHSLRVMLQRLSDNDMENIHYVIGAYNGDVKYYSATKGRELPLIGGFNHTPQPGDTIITGKKGQAELFMFTSSGNKLVSVAIGSNSELTLEKSEKGILYFEGVKLFLKKGELFIDEKVGELAAKRGWTDKVRDNREARHEAISRWEDCFKIYGFNSRKCRVLYSSIPEAFITNYCTGGLRGTQILIHEDKDKGTEVAVLDGSVFLRDKVQDRFFIVEEGYRINIYPDGSTSGPQKIKSSSMLRWWED